MPPALRDNYGRALQKLGPEPPRMSWPKALPVLVIALAFDILHFIFDWFIVFGPVLGGTALGSWLSNYLWDWVAGLIAGTAALVAGVAGMEVFAAIGEIMAALVGLAGIGCVILILLLSNRRIFKANRSAIFSWTLGTFVFEETPFIGMVPYPAIVVMIGRWYRNQIHEERAAHDAWAARADAIHAQYRAQIQAFVRTAHEARQEQPAGEIPEGTAFAN